MSVKTITELRAEIADNFRAAHTYPTSVGARLTEFLTNIVDSVDANYATGAQGDTADTALQPADVGTAAAEDIGFFATAAQGTTADTALQPAEDGSFGLTDEYAGTDGSHQTLWADLSLDSAAGSDIGTDSAFLAAIMGNILGDAVAGEGNYLGGVIGAYSITGAGGSDYPKAALMGIIMDGSTDADAAVLAVIDGSDPSSETRARAAFAVAVNSNEADSGVDYGLDLFAAENPHYTDSPGDGRQGLNIAKAEVRMSSEVCLISTSGVPVDYTDGDPAATGEGYAEIGSLCIDRTNGKLYINGGTKAQPVWKLITSAA